MALNSSKNQLLLRGIIIVVLGFVTTPPTTTDALAAKVKGNNWQKRLDRAFLQVDGVTPEGRFRSFQRALQDPELSKDVSKAIDVVREKGFGKGHPEFIELLWPEGTQARTDLESINALTKQLPERIDQLKGGDGNSSGKKIIDLIQSTQKQVRFGKNDGALAVATSFVERIQSDPKKYVRIAENIVRNKPVDIESPSYELLGKYSDDDSDDDEEIEDKTDDDDENKKKKSFLTVPPLELRRYDAFQAVSVPLVYEDDDESESSSSMYTLQNMGTALTEIFSYLELGDNTESALLSMTAPFFISDRDGGEENDKKDGSSSSKMFVKLPRDREIDPPCPADTSRIDIVEFPETVLASLSFAGICTDKEIDRQKNKLIERIEEQQQQQAIITNTTNTTDNFGSWRIQKNIDDDNEKQPEFLILQYNAPGTLPWRRMNEIAVVMEKKQENENNEEDDDDDDVSSSKKDDETTTTTVRQLRKR